jgi:hypothetical protein
MACRHWSVCWFLALLALQNSSTDWISFRLAVLAGVLIVQYVISARLSSPHDAHLEYGTFVALHFLFATSCVVLQYLGVASAAAGFCWAMSSFSALLIQFALSIRNSTEDITLSAYLIAQLIPSSFGMELAATFMDIFVPLVRRRTCREMMHLVSCRFFCIMVG